MRSVQAEPAAVISCRFASVRLGLFDYFKKCEKFYRTAIYVNVLFLLQS